MHEDDKGVPQPGSAPVPGLPVAGYKATQPPEAIAAVNLFKELEERTLRHIDALSAKVVGEEAVKYAGVNADPRWLAIARTTLQQGFMAANRAIFQPGRVTLPEDSDA